MTDTRIFEGMVDTSVDGPSTVEPSTAATSTALIVLERGDAFTGEQLHDTAEAVPGGAHSVAGEPLRPAVAAQVAVLGVVLASVFALAWLGQTAVLVVVGLAVAAAAVLYRFVVSPWHVSWGATAAEVEAPLVGDDLLDPASSTTRAISIDAPVEQVWAWIVELGIGSEGWCSRGTIRADDDGDEGIVPELRSLGQHRPARAPGAGFEVHRIEAPHLVVSQGPDGTTWCLRLQDLGSGRTRLVSRFRWRFDTAAGSAVVLADPAQFLQERWMLKTLKARAEAGAPTPRSVSLSAS